MTVPRRVHVDDLEKESVRIAKDAAKAAGATFALRQLNRKYDPAPISNTQQATGRTATNPQTGERVIELTDGSWVSG